MDVEDVVTVKGVADATDALTFKVKMVTPYTSMQFRQAQPCRVASSSTSHEG